MDKVEVLAPCGGKENLRIAVASGADAVYLGVSKFNARVNADNFSEEELFDTVSWCHINGVKVYLTINILIKESEYGSLKSLIKVAKNAKVDAYIVQDLGVAALIREIDSNAVLHASTQLGVHNLYGAMVLEQMGFSRVVVSRETTMQDIKEIAEHTTLEIESFVQGALCVSFSGGCYLSSVHNTNSGNRGRCQQLCRMDVVAKLQSKVVKKGYLLSARDLSYAKSVQKLIEAGVTSLKIEGRMRSSLYVGEAVTLYKSILNDMKVNIEDIAVAYNRGEYNTGAYFGDTCGKIINSVNQNHIGVTIGKVLQVKPFKDLYEIKIQSNRKLQKGDGLKFFDGNREIASAGVGNIYGNGTYTIYSKARVQEGNRVSIIYDSSKSSIFQDNGNKHRAKCSIACKAKANKELEVSATSGEVTYNLISTYVVPVAEKTSTTKQEIAVQLCKTQNTPFEVENVEIECDNVFIPKSILNGVRRSAIEGLAEKIVSGYQTASGRAAKKIAEPNGFETRDIFAVDSAEAARRVLATKKTGIICIKPQEYTEECIKNIALCVAEEDEKWSIALELPVYSRGKDIKYIENVISKIKKVKILLANNISCLQFYKKGYIIIAGSGLNEISSKSAAALNAVGASAVVGSIEYRGKATGAITHINGGGKLAVMTLRHCPYQVVFGGDCSRCQYQQGLSYDIEGRSYDVIRTKIVGCQFALRAKDIYKNTVCGSGYYDLTAIPLSEFSQLGISTSGYFAKDIK